MLLRRPFLRLVPRLRDEGGFSILETVSALGVVFVALTGLAFTASIGFSDIALARQRQAANQLANSVVEQARGLPHATLIRGLSTTDLGSDPNIVSCPDGAYYFKVCPATDPAAEKIVHTTGLPSTQPLVPHTATVGPPSYPVTYTKRAYLTAATGVTQVGAHRITVIVSWTNPARPGAKANVEVATLAFRPDGSSDPNTNPDGGTSRAFYYSAVHVGRGTVTLTPNAGVTGGTGVKGLPAWDSMTQDLPGLDATFQQEQLINSNGQVTLSGSRKVVGGTETTVGGPSSVTTADNDPGTPVGSMDVPSPISQDTHISTVTGGGNTITTGETVGEGPPPPPPACPAAQPAIWGIDGLEHGGAGAPSAGYFRLLDGDPAGNVSVDPAAARNGAYGLRIQPTAAIRAFSNSHMMTYWGPPSPRVGNVHFAMKLVTPPPANGDITALATIGSQLGRLTDGYPLMQLGYDGTLDVFRVRLSNASFAWEPWVNATMSAVDPTQWYVMDLQLDLTTSTFRGRWNVNGTAQPTATYAAPGIGYHYGWIVLGTTGDTIPADTYTAHYDDVLGSGVLNEFPLPDLKILRLLPNGMESGFGNPGGIMKDNDGTDVDATSWQRVDELPMSGTADYVRQNSTESTKYAGFTFEDTTETCIRAVGAAWASNATTATFGACNQEVRVYEGAQASHYSAGFFSPTQTCGTSQTGNRIFGFPVAPGDPGPWTQAAVNGLVARMGYSTLANDATFKPRLESVILQIGVIQGLTDAGAGGCPTANPTPDSRDRLLGFETGVLGVATGADGYSNAGGTGVSVPSVVRRSGQYSARVGKTSGAQAYFSLGTIANQWDDSAHRFSMLLESLPAADVGGFVSAVTTGTDLQIGYQASTQKLTFRWGAQAPLLYGPVTPGVWYDIDFRLNTTANPLTASWMVNGVVQGTVTSAEVAANASAIYFGATSATTEVWAANFDDIYLHWFGPDYPLGNMKVFGLLPNGMATSVNPARFQNNDNSAINATTWQRLDDMPMNTNTDYVKQVTAGGSDYVEVTFDDTPETCIKALRHIAYLAKSAAGVNNLQARIEDGAPTTAIFSGDIGATFPTWKTSTGTFNNPLSQAIVNGLEGRTGQSTDISPQPYFHALLLEYAVGWEPGSGGGGGGGGCPATRPTAAWMTGFEGGNVGAIGGRSQFSFVSGFPSVDGVVLRNGAYSMRLPESPSTSVQRTFPVAVGTGVYRFAWHLASPLTTSDASMATFFSSAGSLARLQYRPSSNRFAFTFDSVTFYTSTMTVQPDTWYLFDIKVAYNTNPRTVEWMIDGVAQPTASSAEAASTHTTLQLSGPFGAGAGPYRFDDLFISSTAADYPIGDGKVLSLVANGMEAGNGNPGAALQNDDNTAIDGTSWTRLDEIPPSGADHVKQVTASGTNYVGLEFQDTTETCINAVSATIALGAPTTTANAATIYARDGATQTTVHTGSTAVGGPAVYPRTAAITPEVAPWTQTAVNQLIGRFGFATDVSPVPYLYQYILEYDVRILSTQGEAIAGTEEGFSRSTTPPTAPSNCISTLLSDRACSSAEVTTSGEVTSYLTTIDLTGAGAGECTLYEHKPLMDTPSSLYAWSIRMYGLGPDYAQPEGVAWGKAGRSFGDNLFAGLCASTVSAPPGGWAGYYVRYDEGSNGSSVFAAAGLGSENGYAVRPGTISYWNGSGVTTMAPPAAGGTIPVAALDYTNNNWRYEITGSLSVAPAYYTEDPPGADSDFDGFGDRTEARAVAGTPIGGTITYRLTNTSTAEVIVDLTMAIDLGESWSHARYRAGG